MNLKQATAIAITALFSSVASANLCPKGKDTQVLWKGDWYPAKVVKAEEARCFITYKGYDNSYDEWVGPDRLRIRVKWKGDWYNARVLKINGTSYKVRYDGYSSSDDEEVPISRISLR
jgi:hypothetical protein